MTSMIVLLSVAMKGVLPDPAVPEAVQLVLTVVPDEHVCSFAVGMYQWRDASDPFLFATRPTARLDEQELWATSLAPLGAVRYGDGLLHVLVLGMPVVIPPTVVEFTSRGWRPKWPLC
jgi:hypothetical protein